MYEDLRGSLERLDQAGLLHRVRREVDPCFELAAVSKRLETSGRAIVFEAVEAFIAGVRRMATHIDGYSGFFDILPHGARDGRLRERLVRLYEIWCESNIRWLGLGDVRIDRDHRSALAVQALIRSSDYDPEPSLDVLRLCLRRLLECEAAGTDYSDDRGPVHPGAKGPTTR